MLRISGLRMAGHDPVELGVLAGLALGVAGMCALLASWKLARTARRRTLSLLLLAGVALGAVASAAPWPVTSHLKNAPEVTTRFIGVPVPLAVEMNDDGKEHIAPMLGPVALIINLASIAGFVVFAGLRLAARSG
jgi:hypothetical protein